MAAMGQQRRPVRAVCAALVLVLIVALHMCTAVPMGAMESSTREMPAALLVPDTVTHEEDSIHTPRVLKHTLDESAASPATASILGALLEGAAVTHPRAVLLETRAHEHGDGDEDSENRIIADNDNRVKQVVSNKEEQVEEAFEAEIKDEDRKAHKRQRQHLARWATFRQNEEQSKSLAEMRRNTEGEDFREKLEAKDHLAHRLARDKGRVAKKRWEATEHLKNAVHDDQLHAIHKREDADKARARQMVIEAIDERHRKRAERKEELQKLEYKQEMAAKEEKLKLSREASTKQKAKDDHMERKNKRKLKYKMKKIDEQSAKDTRHDEQKKKDHHKEKKYKKKRESQAKHGERAQKKRHKAKRKAAQERRNKFTGLCSLHKGGCPAGWTTKGLVGLIMYKGHYHRNPFQHGGNYNSGWRWSHPYLCCATRTAKMKGMYVMAKSCPRGSYNTGLFGTLIVRSHAHSTPFHKGGGYNSGWQWTHPYLCQTPNNYIANTRGSCLLAKRCPAGWAQRGLLGLIMYTGHYGNNPFWGGGGYNSGWRWTHPYVCCR